MSLKGRLIFVVMTIFMVFLISSILTSVGMMNMAFDAGQSRFTAPSLDMTVQLLQKMRAGTTLAEDSLALLEKRAITAMADFKQRTVLKDALLKKLVGILLVNAALFISIGCIVIIFSVSRTVKPVMNLTGKIARYPDIDPESIVAGPRSGKEVQLLAVQFKEMVHNITDYQKQLQERSRIDGWLEMSRAIVHEVGNAITPARNAVEVLTKEQPENRNIAAVQKSVVRMEEIFRHIRQLYKTQEIVRVPFNIVDEVQFVCTGYTVSFINTTGFDTIIVFGGRTETVQIVTNLVKNAVEAVSAAESAEVTVSMAARDESLQLLINDNGPGMPPDVLRQIFSPGYSTKSSGFGIGLTLVKKIITFHQWDLDVSSEPDHGTTFTITIPKRDIRERTGTAA